MTGGIFVKRSQLEDFLRTRMDRPKVLYGRRKTGKTFYTRRTLGDTRYLIAQGPRRLLDPVDGHSFPPEALRLLCRGGEPFILDEFHRLSRDFFALLQSGECNVPGSVFLTSTLHYYRRLTRGPDAPLQGLFPEQRVGLVSPRDLLAHPWGVEPGRELVERLVFYQEPTLIGLPLRTIVLGMAPLARSLVGEVLEEEDHAITTRYNAILQAIAGGAASLSEIASTVYNLGASPTPSTSHVTPYLATLVDMGLVERLPVLATRKHVYRLPSPLMDLVFHLDHKYGFRDAQLTWSQLRPLVEARLPQLVERFVERLLAEICGLRPVKLILEPRGRGGGPLEVDIALARHKQVVLLAEVKWRQRVRPRDLRGLEEAAARLEADSLLIVPDESVVSGEVRARVVDVERLVEIARGEICPLP